MQAAAVMRFALVAVVAVTLTQGLAIHDPVTHLQPLHLPTNYFHPPCTQLAAPQAEDATLANPHPYANADQYQNEAGQSLGESSKQQADTAATTVTDSLSSGTLRAHFIAGSVARNRVRRHVRQ